MHDTYAALIADQSLDAVYIPLPNGLHAPWTAVCFPQPRFTDIRYDFGLADGALMDAGCYAVHCLRLLAAGEPAVAAANALTFGRDRRIDRAMTAQFSIPGGRQARSARRCGPRLCCASGHESPASAAR